MQNGNYATGLDCSNTDYRILVICNQDKPEKAKPSTQRARSIEPKAFPFVTFVYFVLIFLLFVQAFLGTKFSTPRRLC
jgi:nitrate reductase NapE component